MLNNVWVQLCIIISLTMSGVCLSGILSCFTIEKFVFAVNVVRVCVNQKYDEVHYLILLLWITIYSLKAASSISYHIWVHC